MYRSRPGVTIKSVTEDLGGDHETPLNRIRLDDAQRTEAPTATAATVVDLCSRRLVGWAIAEPMRVERSSTPCTPPQRTRGNLVGTVFHSDRVAMQRSGVRRRVQHPG